MSTATTPASTPNPTIIFEAWTAFQRSAALKAAIDLDVFTEIARGNRTADSIAKAASASQRGIRILCDYLAINGFLSKAGDQYSLSPEAATFLNRSSPAYFGNAVNFLLDPRLNAPFENLTEVVRTGTTTLPEQGSITPDNPLWVTFANEMAAMMYPPAAAIAERVAGDAPLRVLDIAAGHGLFGIMIAQRNPQARITALDWPNVLAVASSNAAKFNVAERHTTIPGNAFDVDFLGPYDLALATNFFHHFDPPTCEKLMQKIRASLVPGGRCVTLDFIPNDDRVTPPAAASFAMMMLGTTPSGDAYTFAEFETMFANAGFAKSELIRIENAPESIIVSTNQ